MQQVGIIGLGYVGLPLGLAFAEGGLEVVGIDTDSKKVAELNLGNSHVEDVSSERLRTLMSTGKFRVTEEVKALRQVDAVVICLPTPLDENRSPDLSTVVAGAEAAATHLRPGILVVLESTTYPGTTRELLQPIFEHRIGKVGEEFFLAFSPERVDPGNRKHTIENTPKVVGV